MKGAVGRVLTPRQQAWRNLMVATINAALDQNLITLRPIRQEIERKVFSFDCDGLPALGCVHGVSQHDLSVRVHSCYLPTPGGARWLCTLHAEFNAGQAFASGWLKRRGGTYLQWSPSLFRARPHTNCVETLAQIHVKPSGFAYRQRQRAR